MSDNASSQMSAPVLCTVIALDVPATQVSAGSDVQAGFQRMLGGVARQLGAVTEEPGELALVLTVPPETPPDGALRRLIAAMTGFETECVPLKVRAVAHHGVVFRTERQGKVQYVGSAVRSAHSVLRRAHVFAGLAATREFVAFAAKLSPSHLRFEPFAGGGTVDQLSLIRMAAEAHGSRRPGDLLPSSDPELLQYLSKRLAADLGPFATALVEHARRSASTAGELVADLTAEIDDALAKERFKADLRNYIKSRFKWSDSGQG